MIDALQSLSPDSVVKLNLAFALAFALAVFLGLHLSRTRSRWTRMMIGISFLVTSSALGIDLGLVLTATDVWSWSFMAFAAVWGIASGATLRALKNVHSS